MRKLIPLLRTTLQVGRENWRFYRWRIYKSDCPGCGGGNFLSLQKNDLMTRCMSCWATAMNLSLIPVVQSYSQQQKIDSAIRAVGKWCYVPRRAAIVVCR